MYSSALVANTTVNLNEREFAPPVRGRPSDVKRWMGIMSIRVDPARKSAFQQACWARKLEPSQILRDFMLAFEEQYKK